jgi:hypothetical protein
MDLMTGARDWVVTNLLKGRKDVTNEKHLSKMSDDFEPVPTVIPLADRSKRSFFKRLA